MVVFPARPMVPSFAWRLVVSHQSPANYDPVPSMIVTIPSLRDVSCCLSQEHGWWSWLLVQPCGNECPGRTHGLPCSTLAGGCLPLRSLDCYQEDLEGRAPPIEFLVSASPVLGSFSSCRLATQWIASYMLLYKTWHLQRGKMLDGDERVRKKYQNYSVHPPARRLSAGNDGTYEQHLLLDSSR
jgi:hypothetical protein